MSAFAKDVRYAIRALIKRPGFALTAVLILAAGIGATTTIFSVVDTVVLRQLPYPDAGKLVHFDEGSHNYPNFRTWREMGSFESVSAARDYEVDLTGEGPPQRIPAAAVSQAFFGMFGAAPYLGRLFTADDYPGDRSVSVLGHGFWERMGSDPSILGQTLRIDGEPTTVVGVLSPTFVPPMLETGSRVDVWFALDDGGEMAESYGYHVLGVAARLHQDVSVEAAQAEVDAERAALAEEMPNRYIRRDGTLVTTPLVEMREATVSEVSTMLYLLLGAVGMMLLIACANVANLFLARGTARTKEIALRGALGASRARLAVQILTESLLLAIVGGGLGVVSAFGGVELFAQFTPGGIPRLEGLAVDTRILLFSLGISAATGVIFGMLPALQAMRADVNDALKDASSALTISPRGRRVRSGLVVSEIALAVVLLAGAGLLFRSFVAMAQVDPGFDTDQLVVLPLSLEAEYEPSEREQFARELLAGIEALPGTESAAVGWAVPFSRTGRNRCCWRTDVTGDPALVDEADPFLSIIHPVTSAYFETLRAPVVMGRTFEPADDRADSDAAILNRAAAEDLFGSADPVGRTIEMRGDVLTVVGVVEGVHHWGLSQDVEVGVYVPYVRYGPEFEMFEVILRTGASIETVAEGLRAAVWAIDPDLPIDEIVTMERMIAGSLATPRFLSGLLGGFAAVALLLACGGIYGSMLYTVGQRRREMGIRLALGAAGSDVIGLVLRYGLVLAVLGIAIGTVAGLALSRLMQTLVWGIEPTDPMTYIGSAVLLGLTALLASFVPARRAARTDPLQTLRAE